MKIGCNWSGTLKSLIDSDAVDIDYIKTGAYGDFHAQIDTMLSMHPVLLHGLGYRANTGTKNFGDIDFDYANELIKKCSSPHYCLHFGMYNRDIDLGMTEADMIQHMSKQTQIFKRNINVPLLLENMPDSIVERRVYDLYPFVEAKCIKEFIENNDVLFLLDLTHARIAANFRGWDIKEYILGLPIDRLKEIHINGSGIDVNGNIEDTHQSMVQEDYALLEWVLKRINPDIVTLEYVGIEGETEDVIAQNLVRQLDRINQICNH
ncbi:MAG: DUF692 family protein [Clostridiales bacterium]|nr:DUF692 family protein [Clostridiales bacterium]